MLFATFLAIGQRLIIPENLEENRNNGCLYLDKERRQLRLFDQPGLALGAESGFVPSTFDVHLLEPFKLVLGPEIQTSE